MIGRIVVVLLLIGLATAPLAAADGGSGDEEGTCVWTAREDLHVSAGINPRDCLGSGGSWYPTPF